MLVADGPREAGSAAGMIRSGRDPHRVSAFTVAGPPHPRQTVGMTSGPPISERTLILLRHAKSDWSGDEVDIARPLADRGRRQAPDSGRWLNTNIGSIGLVLVSPAERARSTWDLVAAELDQPPRSRLEDRLYAASAEELLTVVRELSDDLDTVVLVGHNPGIADLVSRLTGQDVRMPTSAVAVIDVPGSWAAADQGHARLRTSGRPPAS